MRANFTSVITVLGSLWIGAYCPLGIAQSADEVAKELANPNTALASLNFKSTFTSYQGDLSGADDESGFVTLFQPVLPFPLENGDKIIFRPAIPLIGDQPVFDGASMNFDSESGLGDSGFDLIYAITKGSVLSGIGLIGTVPTATDELLGKDKWSIGPEVFIGRLSKTSVVGALVGHQWDIAGDDDVVEDVSLTTINLFGVYLPGGGWNFGSSPIITHDSEIDQWTVPLNINAGKTMVFGGRPWKFNLAVNYYVEQADPFGPDWSIDFQITPVVENVFATWFK